MPEPLPNIREPKLDELQLLRSKASCAAGSTSGSRWAGSRRTEPIWEIRVDSILKLYRAEKSGPEEQDAAEYPDEAA